MLKKATHAKARVVIFPYAGMSHYDFKFFINKLIGDLELVFLNPFAQTLEEYNCSIEKLTLLTDRIIESLTSMSDLPILLMGFSNGANIAFEVARKLERRFKLDHLWLIAQASPLESNEKVHLLSDQGLIERMTRFTTFKESMLDNQELMCDMAKYVKGEVRVVEEYPTNAYGILHSKSTIVHFSEDQIYQPQKVFAWEKLLSSNIRKVSIPSGHLMSHAAAQRLAEMLNLNQT